MHSSSLAGRLTTCGSQPPRKKERKKKVEKKMDLKDEGGTVKTVLMKK
jgi:hypothetical protein